MSQRKMRLAAEEEAAMAPAKERKKAERNPIKLAAAAQAAAAIEVKRRRDQLARLAQEAVFVQQRLDEAIQAESLAKAEYAKLTEEPTA